LKVGELVGQDKYGNRYFQNNAYFVGNVFINSFEIALPRYSRGRANDVFAKFWEGGYIGVVKNFWGGYTFLVFYCIFINKFCKNFGGRVHFYPPSPPPPPYTVYLYFIRNLDIVLIQN
jgi:hypothetical protein